MRDLYRAAHGFLGIGIGAVSDVLLSHVAMPSAMWASTPAGPWKNRHEMEQQGSPFLQPQTRICFARCVAECDHSLARRLTECHGLQQLLPVIGKMLPPATWLALLKYSPFPESVHAALVPVYAGAEAVTARPARGYGTRRLARYPVRHGLFA
jgi:hypothetical protein